MTVAPKRGYLYWALLDKRRPALVVSANYRNQFASDVLIVPCSTTLRPLHTHVLLRKGAGGLREDSILKCEQVTNVNKSLLKGALGGPLAPEVMNEVVRGVLRAMDVLVPLG